MAKTLDFNTVKLPTLPLVMPDEAHTRIEVRVPTTALIKKLEALAPELEASLTAGDAAAVKRTYELAADLMSCNTRGLQVTAQDLQEKYGLGLDHLVVFFTQFVEFISEINAAKN